MKILVQPVFKAVLNTGFGKLIACCCGYGTTDLIEYGSNPKQCLLSRVFLCDQKGLGLSLREVHLDQWSLTEVLRLHLEASGAFRGHNLQNWRYQQRGGFRLSDDPGFQFCREEPQILGSLQSQSVYELRQEDVLV